MNRAEQLGPRAFRRGGNTLAARSGFGYPNRLRRPDKGTVGPARSTKAVEGVSQRRGIEMFRQGAGDEVVEGGVGHACRALLRSVLVSNGSDSGGCQ